MKRLIVNADDFGLTESVNRGIAEAHRRGIVTSTTLLANGAAFESAVALARAAPTLGVGVHLNLTEGQPVSNPSQVAGLLNEYGCFSGGPGKLMMRIVFGKVRPVELEGEFRAQIEKVRAAGIEVTHLDGHKHVHMLPGIFPIVLRLARESGIGAVRLAVERPMSVSRLLRRNGGAAAEVAKQYLGARMLAAVALNYREQVHRAGVNSPSYFYGITQTGFLDQKELEAILWNLPEDTSELMCHPGYAGSALRQRSTRLLAERERELEALAGPETQKLVAALGIQLIDYRDLAASR